MSLLAEDGRPAEPLEAFDALAARATVDAGERGTVRGTADVGAELADDVGVGASRFLLDARRVVAPLAARRLRVGVPDRRARLPLPVADLLRPPAKDVLRLLLR